jgi:hypothetical protein
MPRPSSQHSIHSDENDNDAQTANDNPNDDQPNPATTASAPKKVLMMRRPISATNDRNDHGKKGKDGKKGEESVSEKAAAYAAARARIMGKTEVYDDDQDDAPVEQKALLVERRGGNERGAGGAYSDREKDSGSRSNSHNFNSTLNDPNYYPAMPQMGNMLPLPGVPGAGGMPVGIYPYNPNMPPTVFPGMAVPPGGHIPHPGVPGAVYPYPGPPPAYPQGGVYPYPGVSTGIVPTGYAPPMVGIPGTVPVAVSGIMPPGGGLPMAGLPINVGGMPPTLPAQGYSNDPPAVRERGPPARAPQSNDNNEDKKSNGNNKGESRSERGGRRGRGARR